MATPTSDQLTAAYMAQVAAVRQRVLAYSLTLWGRSASLRDADVDRLVERIVPAVQAGQIQVANVTNGYVRRLAELEGVSARQAPVDRAQIIAYRGTPATDVYRRPAIVTYAALTEGKPFEEARDAGRDRLRSLVSTDIQQARNRQGRAAYSETGFDYTLRVLSGAENCAMCVIASTQRYLLSDLQPVHPGCDCGERGVRAGRDPGQVIDSRLLEEAYSQIDRKLTSGDPSPELGKKVDSRGKAISDYTDLIISREHGELGPTLTWRSDRFTAAADIDALH